MTFTFHWATLVLMLLGACLLGAFVFTGGHTTGDYQ